MPFELRCLCVLALLHASATGASRGLPTATRLRGGADAPEPPIAPRTRPGGRGRGRGGRGRGRGPARSQQQVRQIQISTADMGTAVRNLTHWEDTHASAAVFAVGNAAFIMVLLGKRALVMLWLAFIAAFVAPKRRELQDWAQDSAVITDIMDAVSSAGSSAAAFIAKAVVGVRARISPSM